jgi:hypothetical protein
LNAVGTQGAAELMLRFAERTGLAPAGRPRRYLWTDAFAVCNFLGLGQVEEALRLVHQVHHELGRFSEGDRRSGWISGLAERDAEQHPTIGGLRIGKPLPERLVDELADPELEWDRDGQYFHYLTKWMHALDRVARTTGRSDFEVWARELAHTAHRAFTYQASGRKRMAWKLSIDLSRPLVASMGQHDPLDGYVTCLQLEETTRELGTPRRPELTTAIAGFHEMIDRDELATWDPLGIGGLLVDAWRLVQADPGNEPLIESLLSAGALGVEHFAIGADLRAQPDHRLPFRELGLAIGLAAVALMLEDDRWHRACGPSVGYAIDRLRRYVPLHGAIASFWMRIDHPQTSSWVEHADINEVMLATALAPDGFLGRPTACSGSRRCREGP